MKNIYKKLINNIGAVILITILGLVLLGATYVNLGPTSNIDGDIGVTAGHGYYIDDVLLTYSDVDAQQADAALTSISGLTYVSPSFIKLTANDTYAVRTLAEVKTDLSLNYVENLKVKLDATQAPTVNNDTDEGYVAGSRWVDVTNDKEYVCLDNTDGAAVWTETTEAGGGAGTYLELTDTPAAYDDGKYAKSTADGIVWDTPAGGGTVTTSGTPVQYDIPRFTDATTIEGRSYSEVKTDLSLNNVTNDAQIAKSIGTAQGDLIYFTGSATPTVLAKGTATQVLAMNAGATAPEWVAAGGYTNLTSFVDQTAWRVFYSNTSGDVVELTLGADGTYLKSNGAAVAPTFETPAGGGDMLKATYDTEPDNIIDPAAGGTGVANAATETITLAGDDAITFTTTAATNVTLPTTGTLATLSEAEVLSNKNLTDIDILNFADATELIIATGAITITQTYHKIDTEGDAASDDLATISGGTAGDVIYLCAENDARTVVLKHDDTAGAGKIVTSDGEDYSLDDDNKVVTFVYNSVDSHWHMIGAAGGGGAGETNTASNIGAEIPIYKQKTGVDLEFRTLKAGSDKITVTHIAEGDLIDIGETAEVRGSGGQSSSTVVNQGNPANATGIIISIEIYARETLSNCEVATFYVESGNYLSTRDTEVIGTVTSGSKQTFEVNLEVQIGDYIGITFTAGKIEYDTSGEGGMWMEYSDRIPCTNQLFNSAAGEAISIYGTGVPGYENFVNFDVVPLEVAKEIGGLLSATTVAFNADADTTLYTVPTGKRCVLSHAIVVAAGDAGATTTVSIGQNTAETDFIPANTLSNLDAEYDSVILQPIPNTTPLKIKSYAAATVIEAQVASQSGVAGNTIYLFGITY